MTKLVLPKLALPHPVLLPSMYFYAEFFDKKIQGDRTITGQGLCRTGHVVPSVPRYLISGNFGLSWHTVVPCGDLFLLLPFLVQFLQTGVTGGKNRAP